MDITKNIIQGLFKANFGVPQAFIFAPGRANIIGEHTDYNKGFVLPFAISQGLYFYGSKNNSSKINILAADTNESMTYDLNGNNTPSEGWQVFIIQALETLNDKQISGAEIVFGGDLPIGAGISSSSALTCGFIALMNELFDSKMNATEILEKSVIAEVGYGVRGGIMDQFTIINGKKDKAILLDCLDNTSQYIDMNMADHHFYLFNTNVKHNLIHTDYNNRRSECEEAVHIITKHYKPIESIRELEWQDLPELAVILEDRIFNRVSFVVQENHRVIKTVKALQENQYSKIGELLYESHEGLSHMYQVSCDELDWLVDYTLDHEQILGARMMGGGFGGCTINLVKGNLDQAWIDTLKHQYREKFNLAPTVFCVDSNNGIIHTFK